MPIYGERQRARVLNDMHRIIEAVNRITGLAAAPHHLPRLAELLRDPNADVSEIEDIIRCDPNLTAGILKWCNSAAHCRSEPVDNIEDGLLRMGFNTVVDLVMMLVGKEMYALPPEAETHLTGLWDHCLLTGILTRKLALKRDGMIGVAFTAGLLHDIGKVLLIKAAPREYSQCLDVAKRRNRACVDQEEEDFGINHANIGAETLGRWKLPASIVTSVWFHHHPGLSRTEHPIACCIELADSLTYAVGHGLKDHYTRHCETSRLLAELKLCPLEIANMLKEALMEADEMKNCFAPSRERRNAPGVPVLR